MTFATETRRLAVSTIILFTFPIAQTASAQEASVPSQNPNVGGVVATLNDDQGCGHGRDVRKVLDPGSATRRVSDPFSGLFDVEANPTALRVPQSASGARFGVDRMGLAMQQPTSAHPTPQHTGFKALLFETGADFKAVPRRRSTWVILGVGAAAAALALPVDDETNAHLVGSKVVGRLYAPGKYLGSFPVQVGATASLYLVGRYVLPHAQGEPQTNKVSHLGFDLTRALIVSQAMTQGVKLVFRKDRPTGTCCGMPSGHAAAAFAAAAVFERHLGYRGAWPTLVLATYIASSRLHDNVHFLSDVLFGSAVGMASGWTVVGRHGRSSYAMVPAPIRGGVMLTLVRTDRRER